MLPDGLKIEGKLFIPSTANLIVRTSYVFVLGFLDIDVPDLGNQVKFSLFGDEPVTFTADSIMAKCGGDGCDMGSKVIAVLGGKKTCTIFSDVRGMMIQLLICLRFAEFR